MTDALFTAGTNIPEVTGQILNSIRELNAGLRSIGESSITGDALEGMLLKFREGMDALAAEFPKIKEQFASLEGSGAHLGAQIRRELESSLTGLSTVFHEQLGQLAIKDVPLIDEGAIAAGLRAQLERIALEVHPAFQKTISNYLGGLGGGLGAPGQLGDRAALVYEAQGLQGSTSAVAKARLNDIAAQIRLIDDAAKKAGDTERAAFMGAAQAADENIRELEQLLNGLNKVGSAYETMGSRATRSISSVATAIEILDAKSARLDERDRPKTFADGATYAFNRHGTNTLQSGFGYELVRQGEFAMGLAAQFAAYGAVSQGISQMKDYQKGVADLSIAMGQGQEQNQSYLNSLADLSRTVGENASDAFDSAAAGIRAFGSGLNLTPAQRRQIGYDVTENATQLVPITGEKQKDTTDQIIAIGQAYGLKAAELAQVADAIAATKRFVGGEPNEIAQGLQRFSRSASTAGIDLNTAAIMIGRAQSTTGESGESIAQAYGRILETIGGTHGDAIASQYANDSLVSAKDRAILRNGNSSELQRLQAFSDIFRNSDTGTRDSILSAIGGTRNRAEATTLLTDMPYVNEMSSKFDGSGPLSAAGQAAKQFNTQMDTLGGTLKRIEGDLKAIAADAGRSGLFDIFGALAKALDPVLQTFDDILRAMDRIEAASHHLFGGAIGGLEIAGGAALYNRYRQNKNSADVGLTTSAKALDGSAERLDIAAGALEQAAGYMKEGAVVGAAGGELGLLGKGGPAVEEELGFLGRAKGFLRGAGGLGFGIGLTALGGALENGQRGTAQNNVGTVLSDAGAGATIGSFFGPEGTVAGALLGGGIGGVKSFFDSQAQDAKNQDTLNQAHSAAQLRIASGDFSGAVKDFRGAAAKLSAAGDQQRADIAKHDADYLQSLAAIGSQLGLRFERLGSAPRPRSQKPEDLAAAGEQALTQEQQLTREIKNTPRWHVSDLAQAIGGNGVLTSDSYLMYYARAAAAYGLGAGGAGHLQVNPKTGASNWVMGKDGRDQAQEQSVIDAAKQAAQQMAKQAGPTANNKVLTTAVEAAVKSLHLSGTTDLTQAQVTSVIEKAFPGLGEDQLSRLAPMVMATLQSKSAQDGSQGALAALIKLEASDNKEIVNYYLQKMKTRLALAKEQKASRATLENIESQWGSKAVDAAGNDVSLLTQVFKHLDASTIQSIEGAENTAAAAAEEAAQMASDIAAHLAQAMQSMSLGGALGSIPSLAGDIGKSVALKAIANNAKAHADAIKQAASISAGSGIGGSGGGGGGTGHQYDYVKSAVAEARAARAGGGDVAAAMAAIVDAQDQLQHSQKNSAQWWRAYAALWTAKAQLGKAEVTEASTLYMLTHDFTDPIVQAYDKVLEAQKQLGLDKKLGFSKETINKDKLALGQAQAADQKAVFDQQLQDIQTKEQLGQISHAAYVRWLQNESKRLHDIKHRSRQQYDEMNQVDQALLQANDSMNAQWNMTSIDARGLIYQVRALSQVAQLSGGAIPGAGIVNNNTNSNNVTNNYYYSGPTPSTGHAGVYHPPKHKKPVKKKTTRGRRP